VQGQHLVQRRVVFDDQYTRCHVCILVGDSNGFEIHRAGGSFCNGCSCLSPVARQAADPGVRSGSTEPWWSVSGLNPNVRSCHPKGRFKRLETESSGSGTNTRTLQRLHTGSDGLHTRCERYLRSIGCRKGRAAARDAGEASV
jgi:hypothetical protein